MLESNRVWSKGDVYGPNDSSIYTAGIHVGDHGNAVECYGKTKEEADERRALILGALSMLSVLKVVQ